MIQYWSSFNSVRRLLVCALILLALVPAAQALPVLNGDRQGTPLQLPGNSQRQLQSTLSIDQAIAIAERRYNGRAVDAREVGNGIYRVRILQDNGKVKTVTITPR